MASRFWVGGTGTWDASDTTHWAASTGGAGGQSVPTTTDDVTLDGASGGGTVTVNTNFDINSITCGAFTGTFDFSANNNSTTTRGTAGFNISGSGTRTVNLGNGTHDLQGTTAAGGTVVLWNATTVTNLTFNANSSTIKFSGNSAGGRNFAGGGKTYSTFQVDATSLRGPVTITGASLTFATMNVAAPNSIFFTNGVTATITNAISWVGTASNPISLQSAAAGAAATLSTASGSPALAWAAVRGITCSGGASFSASNSFDLGLNSGITITAPSSSGGIYRPINGGLVA